jgi:hypothetical protein
MELDAWGRILWHSVCTRLSVPVPDTFVLRPLLLCQLLHGCVDELVAEHDIPIVG